MEAVNSISDWTPFYEPTCEGDFTCLDLTITLLDGTTGLPVSLPTGLTLDTDSVSTAGDLQVQQKLFDVKYPLPH